VTYVNHVDPTTFCPSYSASSTANKARNRFHLARHGVCLLSRTHEQGCVGWMKPAKSPPTTRRPVSRRTCLIHLARHGVCLLSRTHEQECVRWMEPVELPPTTCRARFSKNTSQRTRLVHLARHGVCLLSRTHEQGCLRWMKQAKSPPTHAGPVSRRTRLKERASFPSHAAAYASCLVPTSRDV
jgi:hypothetical protein